jgi:delta14-sterol reductase
MSIDLTFMPTKRGTKLLTSGWWGRSRHPNYLCVNFQDVSTSEADFLGSGDWIMGVAWCLPTAFDTPITYFYALYFAVLLIHRQRRDDEACLKK